MSVYEQAIAYARSSYHFDTSLMAEVVKTIPTIPLTLAGMPYCPACESVLCGACGDCHSWDLHIADPLCPRDHDTTGRACVAWWQAVKAVHTVQSMNRE